MHFLRACIFVSNYAYFHDAINVTRELTFSFMFEVIYTKEEFYHRKKVSWKGSKSKYRFQYLPYLITVKPCSNF